MYRSMIRVYNNRSVMKLILIVHSIFVIHISFWHSYCGWLVCKNASCILIAPIKASAAGESGGTFLRASENIAMNTWWLSFSFAFCGIPCMSFFACPSAICKSGSSCLSSSSCISSAISFVTHMSFVMIAGGICVSGLNFCIIFKISIALRTCVTSSNASRPVIDTFIFTLSSYSPFVFISDSVFSE